MNSVPCVWNRWFSLRPACTERLDFPFPSPWFANAFREPVGESVKQLLSCQRVSGYSVLKTIRFTDQRVPLILMFQTFSSSGVYWTKVETILFHFILFVQRTFKAPRILFTCLLPFLPLCLPCTNNFAMWTASAATPWYLTHNTNTYTSRRFQKSCLPLSPFLYFTLTHIHTSTRGFCNLHAPIWERHTSEKEGGWIRLLGITVAWKAHR